MKLHHRTHRRFILDTVSCDRCDEASLTPSLSLFWQKTASKGGQRHQRLSGSPAETLEWVKTLSLCSPACSVPSRLPRSTRPQASVLLCSRRVQVVLICGSLANACVPTRCFRLEWGLLSWYFHRIQLVHVLLHVGVHSSRCEFPSQTKVIDSFGVVQITPILCQNER